MHAAITAASENSTFTESLLNPPGSRRWSISLSSGTFTCTPHCDEEALLILFVHNPKARIIWAHTGFSVAPARVAELLNQHKDALWGELSYRSGIIGAN